MYINERNESTATRLNNNTNNKQKEAKPQPFQFYVTLLSLFSFMSVYLQKSLFVNAGRLSVLFSKLIVHIHFYIYFPLAAFSANVFLVKSKLFLASDRKNAATSCSDSATDSASLVAFPK